MEATLLTEEELQTRPFWTCGPWVLPESRPPTSVVQESCILGRQGETHGEDGRSRDQSAQVSGKALPSTD